VVDIGLFITSMLGRKNKANTNRPPFWLPGNNADPFPHFMGQYISKFDTPLFCTLINNLTFVLSEYSLDMGSDLPSLSPSNYLALSKWTSFYTLINKDASKVCLILKADGRVIVLCKLPIFVGCIFYYCDAFIILLL